MNISIKKVENGFRIEIGGTISKRQLVAESIDKVKEVVSQEIDKIFKKA
jgi:hypothetical protein